MQYWFYHLEKSTLEAAIAPLLEKCIAANMRVLIRGENQETLKRLDAHLWTYRDDSWLPHGIEGEIDAAHQPILLTNQSTNANGANALFIIENAPLGDISGIERGFYMIDGNDHNLVTLARKEYKAAKENGHDISYWQQSESGKWEKKA